MTGQGKSSLWGITQGMTPCSKSIGAARVGGEDVPFRVAICRGQGVHWNESGANLACLEGAKDHEVGVTDVL